MLDALHEDSNKIKKKTLRAYIGRWLGCEKTSACGRPWGLEEVSFICYTNTVNFIEYVKISDCDLSIVYRLNCRSNMYLIRIHIVVPLFLFLSIALLIHIFFYLFKDLIKQRSSQHFESDWSC